MIAGGAEVVDTANVVLTLTADGANGVAGMRLRNDGQAWSDWGAFAASRAWVLPLQAGEYSVAAQYRDPAGNLSAVCEDRVVLDLVVYRLHLPIVARHR